MTPAYDHPGYILVACLLVATIVVVMFLIGGCSESGDGSQANTSSSVTELLRSLPNLQPYGVESCNYAIEKSSINSRVPSPTDVRVELKGSAKLSESGFGAMESHFAWASIPRHRLPAGLAEIVPAGDLLYSQKLNESFADNPTFAHGFVVIASQEGARRIYFLSTDIDHPIR